MRPSRLAFVLAFVLATAAACRSQPATAPGAGATRPIDRQRCTSFVSSSRVQCDAGQQATIDWCMALGRLAEAAPCAVQAARAFECAARTSASCVDATCCDGDRECSDVNVAFDHCVRGYCGAHAANPDCRGLAGSDASPIWFLSPRLPGSPADPEAELNAILGAGIRKLDDTHYELKASIADMLMSNPVAISNGGRLVPAFKDGKPEGFKLYAIRPGSLYARIGLADGDTIHAINGHRLDSADQALQAHAALRDAQSVAIELVRRGSPLTITITVTR